MNEKGKKRRKTKIISRDNFAAFYGNYGLDAIKTINTRTFKTKEKYKQNNNNNKSKQQ